MLREKELILLENLKKENARKTEEIHQLRNNQLIGQASGEESITITDGAFAFANILEETEIEVEGEKRKAYIVKLSQGLSKQTTREGYNQFNSEIEIQNIKGIEVSYDKLTGYIKLNGTVKTDIAGDKYDSTIFNVKNSGKILVQANIDYTLSIEKISGTYSTNSPLDASSLIQLWDNSSGAWLYPYQLSFYNLKTSNSVNLTKSQTTDITYNQIQLTLRDGDVFDNLIIGIQFNKGELKPFEKYGASPSTLFPSEMENFSVNPNNVYNSENNASGWLDESGAIHSSISSQVTDFIEIDENNFYFMKFNNNSLSATTDRIYNIYNASKNILKSFKYNPTQDTKIFIPRIKDAKYLRATFDIKMTDIVIEEEKRLISTNKNILPIAYNKGQHIDSTTGIDIDFIEKNKIKLNGTTTSTLNLNIINGNVFKWKKGKTYCLQLKIIEGSYSGQALYLHTGFKNDFKDVYNNLQADISNKFKNTINIDEDGYSNKCLVYAKSGMIFNNLVIEVQLEENTTATDIVIPESEEHRLRIGNLELNGINDARDSLVIELADENMSDKKIKKLYLKNRFEKYIFNGTEIINFGITREKFTKMNISFLNSKTYRVQDNYESSVGLLLSNYFKVLTNADAQWLNDSVEDITLNASGNITFSVSNDFAKTAEEFKAKLLEFYNNSRPLEIIYRLNKPELIDITDNIELVKDVEYLINNFKTFKEVTHIEIDNGYIDLEYIKFTELALKNIQQQIDNISALMLEGGTNNA